MATWRPDRTFYPPPAMAIRAPREELAHVAVVGPAGARPDALAVLDVDPSSPAHGQPTLMTAAGAAHDHAGHALLSAEHLGAHAREATALLAGPGAGLATVAVHSRGLLLTIGPLALVVYEAAGLALLRLAWVNLESIWSGALIAAGASTLVL